MLKKLVFCLIVLCWVPLAMSQTMMLGTYGASPAQVKADTVGNPDYLGILDRPYNGLLNVGVETQMYLKGMLSGATLTSPAWTVANAPEGSAAAIGTVVEVDTSTQIAVFTPDVIGTYQVEFVDGDYSASVTINASTYLGVKKGAPNCMMCHNDKFVEWENTGHFSLFEIKLTTPGYYALSCVGCHTTGYDLMADNGGFDDVTQEINGVDSVWAFPDSLAPGTWDALVALYPNSMELARIQCESCHGPGGAHNGQTGDAKIVSSLATANCAICHDDDHYHVYPSQWNEAGHSHIPSYPGGGRTTCQGCHNGAQFIQFTKGEEITVQPPVDITCAVCHEPHNNNNEHQLRTMEATLANGEVVTEGGGGKLCMNCHQNRRESVTYAVRPRSHFGPHYAPQADILIGTNAITFGKVLPTSPHLADTDDACVDCHMHELGSHGEHDAEGNLTTAGMHSFSMVSKDGVDNVAACAECHGDIGETFGEKKYYVNGNADLDGDGNAEGLQEEVHGLMDKLGALLPDADPHADLDSTWTLTEIKAAFNHRLVYYDHSYGIHNPAFTVALLKVTIQALLNNAIDGEIVAIEDVPNDQGKQVRIIWDKFVDDGVAVDPVAKYIVKRDDGDAAWTGVGEHTADGSNRYALVIPTLFDSTDAGDGLTGFSVVAVTRSGAVHVSKPAQGYSVDNLVPQAPGSLMALLAVNNVELTWEEAPDPDINFYRVYRSTQAGFVADENTEITTTADLAYLDEELADGAYYYRVAAVDFSGNLGELSEEVSAKVTTSVNTENSAPTDFALEQNYPNPFNPDTKINFAVREAGHVTLTIYNTLGQKIKTLVDREMTTGKYAMNFNANGLSTGEYLYRIEVTNSSKVLYHSIRKMILMK